METEEVRLSGSRCPGCGGPIAGSGPYDRCAGVRCLDCDWAVVTTNTEHPNFQMARDETPYEIWVEWAGHDRLQAIASVANSLCIGVKATRELFDRGLPIATGVDAFEVVRLHSKLGAIGFRIRVRPEFRWRLHNA